jgi:protease I
MFEKVEQFLKKKTPVYQGQEIRELTGTHVAILATHGFEQSELLEPKKALETAGAVVYIVSLRPGKIRAWKEGHWGIFVNVDLTVREAWSIEFDALVLPGGVLNPDKLRENTEAVAFALSFMKKKRPIAAICHGVQTLIETGVVKGRNVTSYPSLKTDLENAGACWSDQEVVVDHKLITSRKPSDLPAFNKAMIREFTFGKIHSPRPSSEGYAATLEVN